MRRFLVALAVAVIATVPAYGAFQLDSRYQDADDDMVADIPADKAQQADPATMIFAYTPVEDPAVYAEVWQEFIDALAEATGKRVQFFPVQSNAAQIEAMRAGRLHIAGFNTGSNPLAVACAGFRPFAMMAAADGSYGYEMEIITYPGSGIEKLADLKGRTVAFTAETSNSGYKAPSTLLKSELGLEPERDYEPTFSGAHDNSVLGVAHKDYDAAAVANSIKARMIDRGVVKADQFKTLYTSQTFPTTGFGVAHNLTPELQDKIKDVFFSFDWKGTKLEEEFSKSGEAQFIPISFKDHWAVIRQIDEASGVVYSCN
ncbi:MAG: phosphate/phosphite/phosphonate ABC transporter substrate-binding protein [Methyloceanibacter sp.]|uniref:phosphate/phosphite/phosphonate ABC transporter substrate-binding protein n=1 Tax=Methyloceanibacter sp. TaxID=1965321 RepID=UPI003D6D452B